MPVHPWVEPDQDDAAISNHSKIVYMMISFAIGIMTFLVYMLVWYVCTRHRRNNANRAGSVQLTDTGGLSKKAMAALPTIIYKDSGTDTSFDCAVCLGQIEGGEKVRKLPCNHWFHLNCIDMWLYSHSTCPICRHDVTDVSGRKKGETSIRVGNPILIQTGLMILPV